MTPEILGSLLHHCAKTKTFRHGLSLHAAVIKTGLESDTIIGNHVLNFYAKCYYIDYARQVFDKMSHRNSISWSAMVSGYDQFNRPRSALKIFSQMQKYFNPNEFVFASALSSCSRVKELNLGRQIHAQAVKSGQTSITFVLNSLILMYMKCNIFSDAFLIFSDSNSNFLTLVAYNIAITGLMENEPQEKAIELFKIMCGQGLVPDCFTLAALLGGREPTYRLLLGMQLHCLMVKLRLDIISFPGNVLITFYSRFNCIEDSEKAFLSIEERDAISWNTAVAAFCHCKENSKALSFFRYMVMDYNVMPDYFIYASVLSVAYMRHGKEIHAHLIRARPDWDIGVGNALINMYAKNGSIDSGYAVFTQMEIRNLVSWNSMITAFANHGLVKKAFLLFEEMTETGSEPDSITFLGLLIACNHSGLENEGRALFNSMREVYQITPSIEHFCCLVDLLARAGKVSEAEGYISKYCIGDDAVVLGSLLSACRLHGDVITAERIAKGLLELRPITSSPYVLLSNFYASDRKWDGVSGARELLRDRGLKKEAAYSLIEVKGSIEKFVIGDFSHCRVGEMLNLLKSMSRIKDDGLLSC